MGEVYSARDSQLGRLVALKILAPDRATDPSRIQRFLREAQLASSLSHPAIVTVYDSGSATEPDTVHYLAMELVEGQTLSVWTRSTRDQRRIVEVMAKVADGLARAHASGIVHRDLKPENIMVGRHGQPKILDFGIAKLVEARDGADRSDTAPSQAMGTGAYMSPEQVGGVAVDHRADIFAFGAVLYEALTGRSPFARSTAVESMHAVLHDQPALQEVPPDLARILRKCLVKDREERYQSIRDVAIDLREYARQAQEIRRTRRRLPITGAAAAIAVVALAGIGFTRGWHGSSSLAAQQSIPPLVMLRMTNSGNISAGAVSPDGNYIVYATVDGENQTMWVKQVATGTNVRIVPPQPVYYTGIVVSGDGNYVFYTVARRSEPNITDLRRIPILGGESRLVTRDMEGVFTISPDAQRVAFLRFNAIERLYRLMIGDVESRAERTLLARPYPGFFGSLAWAPDGKRISFISIAERSSPMKAGLFNIDVATRQVTRVPSPDWSSIGSLAWLPDGSGMLVTVADRLQPGQIWFLPSDGATARKITSDVSMYGALSVTADSHSIVAHRADVTANLWVADAREPARLRPLTTGLWNCFGNGGVRWIKGGKILYTVCGATSSLNVIDAATGGSQELAHGFAAWQPAVSADGQHIAFISDRSGSDEVWTSDIYGADIHQLTHQGPIRFPSWAPDGRSIYVNTQGNEQAIWRFDLDGHAQRVVGGPTNSPDLSPDHKRLICRLRSTDPKEELWRTAIITLGDEDRPQFVPVPRTGGPPRAQWTSANSFAYTDYVGGVANVWFYDLPSGTSHQVTRFDSGEILAFDVSRDGHTMAMSHGEHVNDIVLIRDFR